VGWASYPLVIYFMTAENAVFKLYIFLTNHEERKDTKEEEKKIANILK
jgi:hypothetical protein